MAQVETLEIEHNFQEDVVNQSAGRAPIDAKKLDQALALVAENQNLINENLKMLQRDDGQLKDAVVGPAQMQRGLLSLVKEFNLRGAYVVATYYAKNDAVDYNGSLWVCSKPHNSTSVFVESNWLRYGASGAEDVSVAAQQAQQAATAAAASLRNANTAAATAETLKTQTEAAATNASNAANSAATQVQQVSQNAGIATSAKNRAETAALKAEAAANSGAITTPKPIASASLAILTGVYYTSGNVPTAEQYKVDVIATDTQIIQTATKGDGVIWTRSAAAGDLAVTPWRNTVEANYIDDVVGLAAFVGYENQIIQTKEYHDGTNYGGATYKFNPAKIAENNGITVINGWVLQTEKTFTNSGFKLGNSQDNTAILQNLLNFAATSEDNNFIVDGAFYFKTGNCSKNISGKSIKLAGAGRDVSKLIFEKEDQTGTSYVNETQANVIARIFNADIITLSGVKVQGITDLANPGGAATNVDAVYYGKVWGFVFDSFNQLRILDSDVTGFNYRGIATACTGLHGKPLNGVVQSNNSNYYGNKGAGLWIQYAELLLIDGGESYKNGFLGQTGTGYGVTASLAVNRTECRAHNFHKNYRKGLDTHGCHDVLVKGCTFTDNVLYHMALLQWGRTGTNTYFAQEENILIDGNVFSKGTTKAGRDFLDAAYAANAANGFTMRINDLNIDGYNAQNTDPTTTLKEVVISNNNFMGNYYPASFCADTTPFRFAIPSTAVTLKGNIIKAKNHVAANFNSMYCASVMFAECKSLKIDSNNIDAVGSNFNYSTQYFGTLVLTQNEQAMDFQLHNNVMNLPKMWILSGYSGAGALYPAIHKIGQGGKFISKGNQLNIAGIPTPDIASYAVLGRLFDSTYPEHYQLNNTIRVGSKMLPQLTKKVDMTESMQPWRTNSAVGLVVAGREILEIIIDAVAIWNIDLYFATQNETVRVQQFAYTFPAGVTGTPSTNFAFSRAEEFTDIDGIKKRRIVIKTLKGVTVNTYFFGTARMSGALGSYGIHEVNYLA